MPDRLPTKLSRDQVTALCQRGFGSAVKLESVQELGGGTFNETYLVELADKTRAILRVAPPPAADVFWDDVALMRREQNILPYFASIATLMPRTILIDFTHQVIERDYVLQTLIEGERWSDIEDELTPDENIELWRQCGKIVRRIHETTPVQSTGEERFGYPYPARRFTRWSEMVLDHFARIYESLVAQRLEVKAFRNISELARANASLLDEIDIPHLLHGDLWTFNLLVRRGKGGPAISGVLDVERAWWGDPMADWIMFLLAIRRDDPAWQGRRSWTARVSAFFEGYGIPSSDGAALFRQEVYKAMHIGLAAVCGAKKGDEGDVARARRELREIARALPSLF